MSLGGQAEIALPRILIRYCTQCKWMLRAAYFGQELLSTFGTGPGAIGEVSLQPCTGGIFTVDIVHRGDPSSVDQDTESEEAIHTARIWDRKVDGGFPETKELKRRVRDIVEPERNLGHVDRGRHDNGEARTTRSADNGGKSATNVIGFDRAKGDLDAVCKDCT